MGQFEHFLENPGSGDDIVIHTYAFFFKKLLHPLHALYLPIQNIFLAFNITLSPASLQKACGPEKNDVIMSCHVIELRYDIKLYT